MTLNIRIRLSTMMFFQFFIWGAWFVTAGTYLGTTLKADGGQISVAYMTQAWGAIIAPFIMGLIADRFFAAQRLLGVLHLAGGLLLILAGSAEDFSRFYPFILLYMILYMPTLALVNSVSFKQMDDTARQFASIRVWGTIGWIIAGMLIGYILNWEGSDMLQYTFYLAGGAAILLGIFSFTLPHTPPPAKGEKANIKDILGLEALRLLKDKNYLIFFLSSILICIPLAFYYQNTNIFLNEIGMNNAAGNMTWGQISEVFFMLLLPIFLKKYGLKRTLLVGMLAWALRYILFAYGDVGDKIWFLFTGIILHGICYDFFFVSGQIYTDHKAGDRIKSAAQGLITLATYGVGMLIGFRLAGYIYDQNLHTDGSHDWNSIWLIPAAIALTVSLLYFFAFKNEKIETEVS